MIHDDVDDHILQETDKIGNKSHVWWLSGLNPGLVELGVWSTSVLSLA